MKNWGRVGVRVFVLAFYFCISLRCFNAVSPHVVFMHHSSAMSIAGRAIGLSFLLCEHLVLQQFVCSRYFYKFHLKPSSARIIRAPFYTKRTFSKLWFFFPFKNSTQGGPGGSVDIATDYGLEGPESNPSGDEIFHISRPALGATQPPVQWIPGLSRWQSAAGARCWPLTPF